MRAYLLSNSSDPDRSASVERQLAEVVPDLRLIASIEEITHEHGGPSELAYVVMVGPSGNEDYLEPLLAIAERNRDRYFFILISDEISASNYKRLIRTGGADWASAARAAQEVVEIVTKRQRPSRVELAHAAQGKDPATIAFVPSAGGVGNSTLVTEIGVQLKSHKAMKDRAICIVDLDFQTSHVCDHLDIEARLQIREILEDPDRLDPQLFDGFVSRYATGLDVFAAPRDKSNILDVEVAALDALFEMIAQRYDWILIDLPVTWFGWTHEVIANSSAVIVTSLNTIPCLRQASDALAAVRAAPAAGSVAVVINRYQRGAMGGIARRKHVMSVLGNEKIFFVRNDDDAMVESSNIGSPLSLGRNRRSVKEIAEIAAFCAQVTPLSAIEAPPKQLER
jgi:pilus assembly protein CpaE